ncbi:MAG: hypothetical protein L3K08_04330 [Thermoplasmata archaeon]|nr:hypothetical protein [Thermoplasmata archaeon]
MYVRDSVARASHWAEWPMGIATYSFSGLPWPGCQGAPTPASINAWTRSGGSLRTSPLDSSRTPNILRPMNSDPVPNPSRCGLRVSSPDANCFANRANFARMASGPVVIADRSGTDVVGD